MRLDDVVSGHGERHVDVLTAWCREQHAVDHGRAVDRGPGRDVAREAERRRERLDGQRLITVVVDVDGHERLGAVDGTDTRSVLRGERDLAHLRVHTRLGGRDGLVLRLGIAHVHEQQLRAQCERVHAGQPREPKETLAIHVHVGPSFGGRDSMPKDSQKVKHFEGTGLTKHSLCAILILVC